jgi:hypothetical protein
VRESASHSGYQVFLGSRVGMVMVVDDVLNFGKTRSYIVVVETEPALRIHLLQRFFVSQLRMVDLQSSEDLIDFESILDLMHLTVDDGHVHSFGGSGQEKGQ